MTVLDRINTVMAGAHRDAGARRAALAAARAAEFSGAARTRDISRAVNKHDYGLSILRAQVIDDRVECFVRAWRDGEQLGFGVDGSVDVERFVVVNPPILIPDDTGPIERAGGRFRSDPDEILQDIILDMVGRSGRAGAAIVPGKEGRTDYTIYSDTADGEISSYSDPANYSTSRAGSNLTATTGGGSITVGQEVNDYAIYEAFVSFNTSSVVGSPSVATLSLRGVGNSSDTDFIVEARAHDWGASLTTADWVAGGSLSALTLLASYNTTGWTTSGYNDFTSESAFLANIGASSTRILLCSSRLTNNNTPTGLEWVSFYPAEDATRDPKLFVTAAAAASGGNFFMLF